jgi:hypothetical protein
VTCSSRKELEVTMRTWLLAAVVGILVALGAGLAAAATADASTRAATAIEYGLIAA